MSHAEYILDELIASTRRQLDKCPPSSENLPKLQRELKEFLKQKKEMGKKEMGEE